MTSLWGFFAPRRTAAALVFTAVMSSAACSDGTSPEPQAVDSQLLGGPLMLEIIAPDSSITERVPFPDQTFSYVCRFNLLAKLSGGDRESTIHWQSADVTWRWLSNNELRHSTVWSMEELVDFWGSDRLGAGQTRASVNYVFFGTQPYRLAFAFRYLVQGEESVRTEESAVRCVGPG